MKLHALFVAGMSAIALAGAAQAQNCLATLLDANNQGSNGGTVYFDVTIGPSNLTFNEIYVNASAGPDLFLNVTVYTTAPGVSHVGNEGNPGAWTQVSTAFAVKPAGPLQASRCILDTPFVLNAGTTQGIAIHVFAPTAPTGQMYTNGTGLNQFFSNADLSLTAGSATNVHFTAPAFTPRVFNGWLVYSGGSAGCTSPPPAPPPQAPAPVLWEMRLGAPQARSRAAGAVVDGFFYFIGGESAAGNSTACWKYDIANDTWSPIADLPNNGIGAGGVSNVAAAVLGTDIYIVGGFDGTNQRNEVRKYDTLTNTWETITSDPHPTGMFAHASVGLGGRVYVIGGQPSPTTFTAATWVYNPAAAPGTRWTTTGLLAAARRYHAATVIDGKIWIGGGIGASTLIQPRTFEVYDPATGVWTVQPELANIGRGAPGLYNREGKPYIVGGGFDQWYRSSERLTGGMWTWDEGVNPGARTFAYAQDAQNLVKVGGWRGSYRFETEVLKLSGGCGCVCNYDQTLGPNICDIFDFLAFGNMFNSGDPCACDLDQTLGPNICDIFDFLAFGNLFNAGCP